MKSFIKTLGIIVLAAVMVFSMAGCSSGGGGDPDDPNNPNSPNNPNNPNYKGGNPNGPDEPPPPPPKVNAQKPLIHTHPQSQIYASILANPAPIGVTATSPDGGELTYQWYRKLEDSNISGEPIENATGESFTPPNPGKSLFYYFVEITNTIPDNGDDGIKTASIRSNPAYIGIAITPLVITGVTGKNKVYDGTTNAELNGTPQLAIQQGSTGTVSGVTLVVGTAKFAQSDVGTDIGITLEGWDLSGDNKTDYKLQPLTTLTANITKAPGAAIAEVTANGAATNNSLAVNDIVLANGQSVEYAISKAANGTGLSAYQSGTSFTGLSAVTDYYVYARSIANGNYETGTPTASAAITTANPKVYFNTDGGTEMEARQVTLNQMLLQSQVSDPVKDGYFFDWWFTDATFTTPFDFGSTTQNRIADNMTLYAKWISNAVITSMRNTYDMEWIRTGPAMLGTTANTRVFLVGHWIGKHEVTQDQWTEIMLTNPSFFKSAVTDEPNTPGKLPVDSVTYYDCLVFCNKLSIQEGLSPAYKIKNSVYPVDWGSVPSLVNPSMYGVVTGITDPEWDNVELVPGSNGYRLPTYEQWEKAARAGVTTAYSTGNDISNDTGWYKANSGSKTHQVGQKPAAGNAWGLYDMHGNVVEWIWENSLFHVQAGAGTSAYRQDGWVPYFVGGCWYDVDNKLAFGVKSTIHANGPYGNQAFWIYSVFRGGFIKSYPTNQSTLTSIEQPDGNGGELVGLRLIRP